MQVKVQILNPDEFLRPEMNATVRFLPNEQTTSSQRASGVVVPKTALRDHDGRKVVFIVFKDKALIREVHILSQRSGGYLVDGLVGGEDVVTSAPQNLKDGQKIKIKGQS